MNVDELIQIIIFFGVLLILSVLFFSGLAIKEIIILHRKDKKERELSEWEATWPTKRKTALRRLGLSEDYTNISDEHTPVRLLPRPYDWQQEQLSNGR